MGGRDVLKSGIELEHSKKMNEFLVRYAIELENAILGAWDAIQSDPNAIDDVMWQVDEVETRVSQKHKFVSQMSDELEMKLEALERDLEGVPEDTSVKELCDAQRMKI